MRVVLSIILILVILQACKSFEVPDIEKSESRISISEPLAKMNDALINNVIGSGMPFRDITIKIKAASLNTILKSYTENSVKDIIITFLLSRKIVSNEYSFFGAEIENYVNLDTGNIDIDIKTVEIKGKDNVLSLRSVLYGKGGISLSARYLGIPAGASPDMEVQLDEWIDFHIIPGDNMELRLEPVPKKLFLKTKFFIDFLAWQIPWSEDIELDAAQIIKPIKLPLSGLSDLNLPLPSNDGKSGSSKIAYKLNLTEIQFNYIRDVLEISCNVGFVKK